SRFPAGRMAARCHCPSSRRTRTPPAENSRFTAISDAPHRRILAPSTEISRARLASLALDEIECQPQAQDCYKGGGQPMNLQPLGDRLIVEVLEEEETTVSGIVLPDTAKEKPQRGRVLAVGPGARDENGEHVAMDVEEGDEVIFSKYGGTEIKVGADDV